MASKKASGFPMVACDIMPHELVTIRRNEKVADAIAAMRQSGFRRLPVIDSGKGLAGLITSIDILRALSISQSARLSKIAEIMEPSVYTFQSRESLHRLLTFFDVYRKGGYPVVDKRKVKGIVTEFDFLSLGKPKRAKVAQLMTHKPVFAAPEFSLREAARIMIRAGTRRLPVVGEGLEGIITPYDIMEAIEGHRFSFAGLTVEQAMVKHVISLGPHDSIREASSLIMKKRLGGMPVVDRKKLVGILTERDVFGLIKRQMGAELADGQGRALS